MSPFGIHGYFLEVHQAPCDGHSMTFLKDIKSILEIVKKIDTVVWEGRPY